MPPTFVFHYTRSLPPEAVQQPAPMVLVTHDMFIVDFSQATWFQRAYPNSLILETGQPEYGTPMVSTAPGVPIPSEPAREQDGMGGTPW
jgi:hypothetical protein